MNKIDTEDGKTVLSQDADLESEVFLYGMSFSFYIPFAFSKSIQFFSKQKVDKRKK